MAKMPFAILAILGLFLINEVLFAEDNSTINELISNGANKITETTPYEVSHVFGEFSLGSPEIAYDLNNWTYDDSSKNSVNYAGLLDYAYYKEENYNTQNASMRVIWWLGFKDSKLEIILFRRDFSESLIAESQHVLITGARFDASDDDFSIYLDTNGRVQPKHYYDEPAGVLWLTILNAECDFTKVPIDRTFTNTFVSSIKTWTDDDGNVRFKIILNGPIHFSSPTVMALGVSLHLRRDDTQLSEPFNEGVVEEGTEGHINIEMGEKPSDEIELLIEDLRAMLLNEYSYWELKTDGFKDEPKETSPDVPETPSENGGSVIKGGQLHLENENGDMIYLNWEGSYFTCSLKSAEYAQQLNELAEEQAREAEEAARRALECPLEPLYGWITRDSASVPYVYSHWKNVTEKTIDAYEVEIRCYDRFGDPVYHYAHGSNVFKGQSQYTIKPGRKTPSGSYWYMHGFDLLAEARLNIIRVHFTDGTTKKPKSDCETMTVYLNE